MEVCGNGRQGSQATGRFDGRSAERKTEQTISEKALAALHKEAHKPLRAPVIIMVASLAPIHPKIRDIRSGSYFGSRAEHVAGSRRRRLSSHLAEW